MLSTSCVAQRSAMFTTALGKAIDGSSLQWAKPDEQRQLFLQLITQSCLYMAALRCGVDTARLDLSALESVNVGIFDNFKALTSATFTFDGCVALTGESPYTEVNGVKYHLYERTSEATAITGFAYLKNLKAMFKGCTKLTDYDKIPDPCKSDE